MTTQAEIMNAPIAGKKILLINQFFWPDSSATSQQLTDVAAGLAARGHQVSVLCGEGGYAAAASAQPPAGVAILRVKALAYSRGTLGRVLSYASFYAGAFLRAFTLPKQDIVVSLTTPPLISLLGMLLKIVRGSRHFVYEQDMYPDVAVDLGMFKRGGLLAGTVGFFADLARRHSDGVIALGLCMRDRLTARGIPAERIFVAENWANGDAITPMTRPGDANELVLLYSGNLGQAHDLETLERSMLTLRDDPRFRFLFVGSGKKREELADFCTQAGITSLELRPYVSRDKLSEGLAAGDIGLVTQHNVCCGSVVPSKVYGIMAAGRPILFIGPKAATPGLLVERHDCGWQIDCGDDQALSSLLLFLADNPHLVHQAGARARKALLEHYDVQPSIDRLANILVPLESGSTKTGPNAPSQTDLSLTPLNAG